MKMRFYRLVCVLLALVMLLQMVWQQDMMRPYNSVAAYIRFAKVEGGTQ